MTAKQAKAVVGSQLSVVGWKSVRSIPQTSQFPAVLDGTWPGTRGNMQTNPISESRPSGPEASGTKNPFPPGQDTHFHYSHHSNIPIGCLSCEQTHPIVPIRDQRSRGTVRNKAISVEQNCSCHLRNRVMSCVPASSVRQNKANLKRSFKCEVSSFKCTGPGGEPSGSSDFKLHTLHFTLGRRPFVRNKPNFTGAISSRKNRAYKEL
jgi:hypothetical protein